MRCLQRTRRAVGSPMAAQARSAGRTKSVRLRSDRSSVSASLTAAARSPRRVLPARFVEHLDVADGRAHAGDVGGTEYANGRRSRGFALSRDRELLNRRRKLLVFLLVLP